MTATIQSPLRPEDIEEVRRLQPPDWQDIVPIHRFYLESGFCRPIAVREGGTVVGIGTLVLFGRSAWLAHIIVDAEKRNRGIGRCIVSGLLEMVDRNRYPTVSLIATELGAPVYANTGFRVVGELVFMERKGPRNGEPADERIGPLRGDEAEGALSLDLRAVGDDRASLLGPRLEDAVAFRDARGLRGFYLPVFGDGPIIAMDAEAGRSLAARRAASRDAAVMPSSNEGACAILSTLGFTETKRAKKMALGPDLTWRPDMIYNRIGGNFG